MSARDNILNRIRGVALEAKEMPSGAIAAVSYKDKVAHFAYMLESVGGAVVEMKESLSATVATIADGAVVSTLEELHDVALNPDEVADVHELGGNYTAVVRGGVAVVENGAVWVPVEGRRKAHIFACQHLVIVVDRRSIVDTMHDAVAQLSLDDVAYGAFISGPSKTADIEQALVLGAHGAMKTTIILY